MRIESAGYSPELCRVIDEFNALNEEGQSQVMDILYDGMYQKTYREIVANRAMTGPHKNAHRLIKGLLIIIGNVKHYLGDRWDTLFPNGSHDVDAYLEKVDRDGILKMDTWSRYENRQNSDQDTLPFDKGGAHIDEL
jgi:hypothetical protein